MRKVSSRTLVVLVGLLVAVLACQHLTWAEPASAEVIRLDDEPPDPNESEEPQPEAIGITGTLIWLDDEPPDPNESDEPPDPDECDEPEPENA